MNTQQLGPLLVVAVLGLIGVVMLIVGLRTRQKAQTSQSWPAVPGLITHSQVDSRTTRSRSGNRTTTRTSYYPVIRYSYNVGGMQMEGNRITFGGVNTGLVAATAMCNKYPAGSQVNVFFDPQKPKDAVLVPGASGTLGTILFGIFFLILACGGGVYTLITLFK